MATILIVDDHVLNREFLMTLLGYGGHRLLEAANGIEGLKMLYAERPHLVITDILMPRMDGYEFVTRIHADPRIADIPIIFYTATYRESEANMMARACGVHWVLPKPSDPEVILRTVQEALGLPAVAAKLPVLTPPPPEGSRFSTIENQLAEYFVEIETSRQLVSKIAQTGDGITAMPEDLGLMTQRLSKSLSSLQAVSLRLTSLIELGIDLAAERDAVQLIEIGCRVAQNICVSKYAAIGVLGEDSDQLTYLVTRGLDDDAQARFISPSSNQGILSTLLDERTPFRLSHLSGDPRVLGLPPSHPPVHSFLGVSIASPDRIYGWLYLVDKLGAPEFSEVDEKVATTVAAQLAIAYENLVLFDEVKRNHAQLKTEIADRVLLDEDLQRFRLAMDTTADAIFLIDRANMVLVDVNATACSMLGYAREELLQLDPLLLTAGSHEKREKLERLYDNIIASNETPGMTELQLVRKDGSTLAVEVHRRALLSGGRWIMVAVARDISDRKEAEHRLLKLAHYDTLTGLPNRTLFFESLRRALSQAAERRWIVAVLFLDIDRFKNVNDTLGHPVGDELLRQFSARLVDCLRIRDTIGRLGGDEFAAILIIPDEEQRDFGAMDKIREAMRQPFDLHGHEVTVTTSIGVTMYPNDACDPDTLIRYADTAMYRAKEAGRDTYRYFTAEMNAQAIARLEVENALRKAIDHDEFVLYFQPKVHIGTGQIIGAEALIRWDRPGYGQISPALFVPLLEETGLIVRVGTWVITEACKKIGEWERAGIAPVHISVNVSGRQFFDGNLEMDVLKALKESSIEPELLELELTESSLMSNAEETIAVLRNLKNLGIQISVDDFGTGYSSLAYLKRFPIDKLKIDIAFIREVTTNPDDAAIVLAIIRMAHSLKLQVIAEGVETEAQLAYLRRHLCDEIQGYYFSQPVTENAFTQMIQQGKRLPRISAEAPSQQTLLILDDDATTLAVLSRVFVLDGYQVLTALSPAEGFELLAKHPVQVIICDQSMPVMNGTEFLSRVKDLYPDTFRIILSAYNDLQPIMDGINQGSLYRFYTKPWNSKILRKNIREAFRQYWHVHGATSTQDS